MTNKPTPPNPPLAPKPRSFAQIHSVLDKLTIKHETAMARLDKEYAAAKEERLKAEVRLKAVEQEVGSLSDGTVLEEDIFHALKESRTICNIPLDNVEHDVKSLRGDQFDIVGTNGKYVVVIEIKRTLNSDDAARFAKKKKPVFEQAFASMIGKKKVLGAMIYRRANKKARTAALENGLLLVHSVGKKKLHQTFE